MPTLTDAIANASAIITRAASGALTEHPPGGLGRRLVPSKRLKSAHRRFVRTRGPTDHFTRRDAAALAFVALAAALNYFYLPLIHWIKGVS